MHYLKMFVVGMSLILFILFPAWITWIPKSSCSLLRKRIAIITMAAIATVITVIVVAKPIEDPTTRIVGKIAWFIYLISVYISVFYSWPGHKN